MDIASQLLFIAFTEVVKTGTNLTVQALLKNVTIPKHNYNEKILDELIMQVNCIKDERQKLAELKQILEERNKYTEVIEYDLYQTMSAKRIDYFLALINRYSRQDDYFNLERLADYLGFPSVNELKRYYLYWEEPLFSFSEEVADKLGISCEWLKFGKGFPFMNIKSYPTSADALEIADYDVKYDFAILKSYELSIIRREGRIKRECLSSYPFRKQVGRAGRRDLKDLYDILKELDQKNKIGSGYYLREEDYYDLKQGKIYPGALSNLGKSAGELVLDFMDIYHKFPIAESYERIYGEEFLEIQQLVKNEIERE